MIIRLHMGSSRWLAQIRHRRIGSCHPSATATDNDLLCVGFAPGQRLGAPFEALTSHTAAVGSLTRLVGGRRQPILYPQSVDPNPHRSAGLH